MGIEILMPALSPTMETGQIVSWQVKEGQFVRAGDIVAEIETDKATMELEAAEDGFIAKILFFPKDGAVPVGRPIAVMVGEEEELKNFVYAPATSGKEQEIAAADPSNKEADAVAGAKTTQLGQEACSVKTEKKATEQRKFITPLARRLAAQKHLDINTIEGTGPKGRIIQRDVEALLQKGEPVHNNQTPVMGEGLTEADKKVLSLFCAENFQLKPHSLMRKTIARRLCESKQNVPHFYVAVDCCMDALLELRQELNKAAAITFRGEGEVNKISVNDLLIKAVAVVLKTIPEANVSWLEGALLQHHVVDVAVAVAVAGGLITPIVREAEKKNIAEISSEMKGLIKAARQGSLMPQQYQGGSTSVSNMGMYKVKSFSAILNPPQATIFAFGASRKEALVRGEEIKIGQLMQVTLSADHRAIDGACAAECMALLQKIIENPLLLLQ